jgi:predicted phosphodiesterase
MSSKWTNKQLGSAITVLRKFKGVNEALHAIQLSTGRRVTASALRHTFKVNGLEPPHTYLFQDLSGYAARIMKDHIATEQETRVVEKLKDLKISNVKINLDQVIRPVDGLTKQLKTEWPRTTYEYVKTPVSESYNSIAGCDINSYRTSWRDAMEQDSQKLLDPKSLTSGWIGGRFNSDPEPITKIMVCPDAHHPYVDKKAWKTFLAALRIVRPDILVIIGDFGDFLSISAHAKKAKDEKRFKAELDAVNVALDEICAIGLKRVIYVNGNHESRFDRYINSNAPELDDVVVLTEKLRLKERGLEHVPYGEFIRIGQIAFSHDVGRCGVNAARQSLSDFGDNLVFGHSHRGAVVYGGTVEGKTHVCMNVGWLGDYNAIDYRNRNTAKREWQHGCGLIYQTDNGESFCNFIPFIDGRCVIDGKYININ